jgi:hypothetical protein
MEPDSSSLDIDEIEADAYDELLLTEPLLPKDGVMVRAKIIGRKGILMIILWVPSMLILY